MKTYWNGEEPLGKTFWRICVLGSLATTLAGSTIAFITGYLLHVSSTQLAIVTFLILLLFNPYYIFCWVAVWRSSSNTKIKLHNWGAKALVMAHAASIAYDLTRIPEITGNSL
jgi:hypothetical protein